MRWTLSALLLCAACQDETVTAYLDAEGPFRLIELDGLAFEAEAVLDLSVPGRVSGRAPCNSFSGAQAAPYPWFEATELAVTRRACPELAHERAFLAALQEVQFAESLGAVLILSNAAGREMVFQAAP